MVEILSSVPWSTFTWPSMLMLVGLMVIRGDIVSRKIHEEVKTERDYWRSTAMTLLNVNEAGITLAETSAAILDAIPKSGGEQK